MSKGICTVVEQGKRCPRPIHARGYCTKHYQRWQGTGDPLTRKGAARYVYVKRPGHPVADARGYAALHRVIAYDAGLLVDLSDDVHHRDDNTRNNAIGNLEVASRAEHMRQHKSEITHCAQGHEFTPENTYMNPRHDRKGSSAFRSCRECRRLGQAKHKAKRKARE